MTSDHVERKNGTGASLLCFGTSTFVAGRLNPTRDSEPGKQSLRTAIRMGVRMIHSNPKLRTQWAVREVLDELHTDLRAEVRHLVKVEVAPDADDRAAEKVVQDAIETSYQQLGVNRLWGVAFELNLKRCSDLNVLGHERRIKAAFVRGAQLIERYLGTDAVKIGFAHSSRHLRWAMDCGCYRGFAANFNLLEAWPAFYLPELQKQGALFFAVGPLQRGLLTETVAAADRSSAAKDLLLLCREHFPSTRLEHIALSWAVAHPAVTAAIVTTAHERHLLDTIHALGLQCHQARFDALASAWASLAAARSTKQ